MRRLLAQVTIDATAEHPRPSGYVGNTDFDIDLTPIGACLTLPIEARRADLCADLSAAVPPAPPTTYERRAIALGAFHPKSGGVALVSIYGFTRSSSETHTQSDATHLVNEVAERLQKAAPKGAHARASDAHIVKIKDGVDGVRGDIDLDGLPPSASAQQHVAIAIIDTDWGAYEVSVSGPSAASAETDAALDAVLPSMWVRDPARDMHFTPELSRLLGVGAVVIVVAVLIVIAIVFAIRRSTR